MSKFKDWEYASANTISVVGGVPSNPKKVTGTRLGAVLGLNHWKSDFEAWCEICRVGEQPFEGNKFTDAGIAIEPKLLAYCKEEISPYIYSPEEWFKSSRKLYDHFPSEPIFGGMWDGIILDGPLGTGAPIGVVEAKTSSRPQDWMDSIPDHYLVQGLEYAQLLEVERVYFPVALLEPEDYDNPQDFVCTDDNTILRAVNTTTTTINGLTIADLLQKAMEWYEAHVIGNVSPTFDTTADKAILAVIQKSEVSSDELETIATKVTALETTYARLCTEHGIKELEKEIKDLKDSMKPAMIKLFNPTDEAVTAYGWQLKRSMKVTIDKKGLEKDNLLDKYSKQTESYTLSKLKEN